VKVHLGVEPDFRPAAKAHLALVVEGIASLVDALASAGHPVTWDAELAGVRRCYVADPFGNRIELIEA
jgi:catechol 2,3-dioxygenase-like lactoylglutathione lyase family enzyme